MKRHLTEAVLIASVCTVMSYVIAYIAEWIPRGQVNWLEVFAVFTSFTCTWLCVRQRRINYPIGAVSTAAYAILFWQADLLASAALNAYLTPALIYGWFRWRKDAQTRPVGLVTAPWWLVYFLVTWGAYFGAVLIFAAFGAVMVWTDAVILVGTMVAQFLLDNKKLETWGFWAIVNVFAIYTYAQAGLPLASLQYVLFLINTIIGFIVWKRSYDRVRTADGNAADHGTPATDPVR